MDVTVRCERVAVLLPNEGSFDAAYRALPDWRRRKCDALRFVEDRRRSVAVWLLLRQMLGERGVDADRLTVSENEFGKPVFEGVTNVHFSLSHSGDRVMAAVSDRPVGCDVEQMLPIDDAVCRRALSAVELSHLMSLPSGVERDLEFCRLWTQKESYLKATGRGFSSEPKAVEVLDGRLSSGWELHDFDFGDGYFGCVCAEAGSVIR